MAVALLALSLGAVLLGVPAGAVPEESATPEEPVHAAEVGGDGFARLEPQASGCDAIAVQRLDAGFRPTGSAVEILPTGATTAIGGCEINSAVVAMAAGDRIAALGRYTTDDSTTSVIELIHVTGSSASRTEVVRSRRSDTGSSAIAQPHDIALGPDGSGIAAYGSYESSDGATGTSELVVTRFGPGGSSPVSVRYDFDGPRMDADVAVAPDGRMAVVYGAGEVFGAKQVHVSTWAADGTAELQEHPLEGATFDDTVIRALFTADPGLVLAWQPDRDQPVRLRAYGPDGAHTGADGTLGSGNAGWTAQGVDDGIFVAWSQSDGPVAARRYGANLVPTGDSYPLPGMSGVGYPSSFVDDPETGRVLVQHITDGERVQLFDIGLPQAFTWEVRPRLERPEPGTVPDLPDEPEEVQHAAFPVDFEITDGSVCAEPVEWLIDGEVTALTPSAPPCGWSIEFPAEGEHHVELRVEGESVHDETIDVQDELVVILGDSIASGEGNPDAVTPVPGTYPDGRWVDDVCHRSLRSGHAEAALRMEEDDPHTSVTLVHLACSGATVTEGLLGPQTRDGVTRPGQISAAAALVGEREVDAALVSIGANDLEFASIAMFCSANGFVHRSNFFDREDYYVPCYDLHMALESRVNVSFKGLQFQSNPLPIPELLDVVTTKLCVGGDPGETSISVREGDDLSPDYEVSLNWADLDLSDQDPVGPSRSQETRIAGGVRGPGCPGGGGSGSSLNPLLGGGGVGVTVDLTDPLAEPHPLLYVPEDSINDHIPVVPSPEVVRLEPEFTVDELAEHLAGELDGSLTALGPALAELVAPEDTYVTEYGDPLTNDEGGACGGLLTFGVAPDSGIDVAESRWARASVLGRLNGSLAAASSAHGWTFVAGPGTDFVGHGLCATEPWFLDVIGSLQAGSSWNGTLHPTPAGHESIAEAVVGSVVDDVVRAPAAYESPASSRRDYSLQEFLQASGDLVYVDPDAEIFEDDVVLIEHNDEAELRRVIGVSQSSFAGTDGLLEVRLDQGVATDHPAGSRLLVIDELDALPPEGGGETLVSARDEERALRQIFAVAAQVARFRYPDPGADPPAHVVLGRVDAFADALAGSALTGDGPLLLTPGDALEPLVAAELQRLLAPGGTVYVLGGEVAISAAVVAEVEALGFTVVRLSGPTRVETALAVADVVVGDGPVPRVAIARSNAPADNPTAAWADSVAGGGWAAEVRAPILLTPTDLLHPAVEAWLAARQPAERIVLGGSAAIDDAVVTALGATRVAGPSRAETAIAIGEQLWDATTGYVLVDGFGVDGWAYGLIASGVAADADRPVLLSSQTALPAPTAALVDTCPDLAVVGDVVAPGCWEGEEP